MPLILFVKCQALVDTDLTWRHRDSTSGEDTTHWQWNAFGTAFMLNVDVALYKVGWSQIF